MRIQDVFVDFQNIDTIPGRIAFLEGLCGSEVLEGLNVNIDALITAWQGTKKI